MITLNYRKKKKNNLKSHEQRCTREAESKTLPGSLTMSHWVVSPGAARELLEVQ